MPPKQQTDNTAMRELKKALRQGGLKNLYVFYGDETFLREYYLGELKKAILPQGMEDFNLHTAQGKECSVDWIAQAVDCLPMMSERTLVLVTDFDLMGQGEKGRQQLLELFEDLPDYCCLVFVALQGGWAEQAGHLSEKVGGAGELPTPVHRGPHRLDCAQVQGHGPPGGAGRRPIPHFPVRGQHDQPVH